MTILEHDLQSAIKGAEDLMDNCPSGGKANISDDAKIIIIEMVFQLGKSGVSKFPQYVEGPSTRSSSV